MNSKILREITHILNSEDTLRKKKSFLEQEIKRRRIHNKELFYTVSVLLSENILPIRNDEKLELYGLQRVSETAKKSLCSIIEKSSCQYFNATCGEFLWQSYHERKYAEIALNAYFSEMKTPSYEDEFTYTRLALGICRIYSKYQAPVFSYEQFEEECLKYIGLHLDDSGYGVLFILEGLLSCKKNTLKTVQALQQAIQHFVEIKNYERGISFAESLEKYYMASNQKDKLSDLRRDMARMCEDYADCYDWSDPAKTHEIIRLIQKSMNLWECAKKGESKSERKRLAKRIEPVKKLSLQTFQCLKGEPMDITAEVDKIETFIEKSSFENILWMLARLTPLVKKEGKEQEIFSLTSLFPTSCVDSKGRVRCIIPSAMDPSPQEKIYILEYQAAKRYEIFAGLFVKRYIWFAKKKEIFTSEKLRFLVDRNAFIPSDRKETFLKGLLAGFELDLPTAMHLLMPQVENAIRCLAEDCGAVVYKTDSKGVEECLSLESVLQTPEIEECLDEDFLFNLRLFYTSEYGFGMRNIVCHGLNSDAELHTLQALAVWWFTLHICCLYCPELHKKVDVVQLQAAWNMNTPKDAQKSDEK